MEKLNFKNTVKLYDLKIIDECGNYGDYKDDVNVFPNDTDLTVDDLKDLFTSLDFDLKINADLVIENISYYYESIQTYFYRECNDMYVVNLIDNDSNLVSFKLNIEQVEDFIIELKEVLKCHN